jgi:hypothetical protein
MNLSSRKHLFLCLVVLVGLTLMVGQLSAFAQPSGPADQNPTARSFLSRVVNGGIYQVVDNIGGNTLCKGQCATPNWQTSGCSCPDGFTAFEIGRFLTDATGAQCGSTQFMCIIEQPQ